LFVNLSWELFQNAVRPTISQKLALAQMKSGQAAIELIALSDDRHAQGAPLMRGALPAGI